MAMSSGSDAALDELIEAYLATINGRSANTVKAYRRDLLQFSRHCQSVGITEWAAVDSHCIRHYVAMRHHDGLQGPSLARSLSAFRSYYPLSFECILSDNKTNLCSVISTLNCH